MIGPAGFSRASKLSHRNLNVMSELRTGDGICHKELIDLLNSNRHYRDFCFAVKAQLANWWKIVSRFATECGYYSCSGVNAGAVLCLVWGIVALGSWVSQTSRRNGTALRQ